MRAPWKWALACGSCAVAACIAIAAAVAGCNNVLGIHDRQLPTGGSNPATGPGDQCQEDSDCPTVGCYVGQCDDQLHVCRYSLCRGRGDVCQQGTCVGGTSCSQSTVQYTFRSVTIGLPDATLGCGGDPSVCVAAVYPFVLVGTSNGAQAVFVGDVTNSSPRQFPVTLPFAPAAMLASPPYVYAVGTLANGQLPLATIEVHPDPNATTLAVVAATLSYPFDQPVTFPGPLGGIYLVDPEGSQQFPAALIPPPLKNGSISVAPMVQEPPDGGVYEGGLQQGDLSGGYAMYRSPGVGAGGAIVGPSGPRLVYQSGTAGQYGLVENAGTPAAAAILPSKPGFGGQENVLDGGQAFVSSPEGALYWAYNQTYEQGACGCGVGAYDTPVVHTSEFQYTTGGQNTFQTYNYACGDGGCKDPVAPPSAPLPYPLFVTVLDSETSLAIVVNSQNASGPPSVITARNYVGYQTESLGQQLDLTSQPIGLVSSNHLAFVLTQSTTGLSLAVLDPDCP